MKEYKILKVVFLLLIIGNTSFISHAQEQDPFIKRLDSPKYVDRLEASMIIDQERLYQYASALEQRIFLQDDPNLVYSFLRTLETLNSTNLYNIAQHFIDTIDYYPNVEKRIDLLKAKAIAAGILIDFNNFTKINYIFEVIERDKEQQTVTPGIIALLSKLLYNPALENQAKERMLYFFNSNSYKSMPDGLGNPRPGILSFLKDKYGLGITDLIINSFLFDPSVSIRGASLDYLIQLKCPGLDTLLIYKLYMDSDSIMRPQVALTIATRLNTPERLYILKNYKPPIQNEHRAQGIATYVAGVIPKQPVTESTIQSIDTTISFIDVLYSYSWLGDLTFSNELKSILTTAKTDLQNGDSLACRVQVKAFQDLVDNVYKDSLNSDARFVTTEGWKFLYWNAQYILDRLPEPPANPNLLVNLKNSLGEQIAASNVQYYEGSWKDAVNNGDGTFTVITTKPTVSIRVYYEYASMQADNVNAQNNSYTFTTVNAAVQLKNSLGNLIPAPMGDQGTVQYYAGAWRSFGTTSNGVAYKELLPINYSFRMTYEYGSQDKQQNLSVDPTVVFQTVNAAVQLKNSLGNLMPAPMGDAGTVQYYAGAWRTFGTTSNGVAYKELLPINYSFRMTYEYGSIDKQQNLSSDPTVVFQTVNAAVQLKNSLGNLMPAPMGDQGTVQYYAGAWRSFGTTSNGVAYKELLPINYSFRMTYEYANIDKQQNLSVDPTVVFQTVNASVQLKNSSGNLMPAPMGDQGTVQYYAGAWRSFGTTSNGVATKELLPINYSFRMTYEFVSKDKQQNLSTNPVVDFSTVLCTVKVTNSANQPLSNAEVKYYSGAWRNLGTTNVDGIATKELLPANLSFRATSGNVSLDKQQDISVNSLVEILLNIAP